MAGERCSNCGAVILTSRSACLTCGHQAQDETQAKREKAGQNIRGWFVSTREPALPSGGMIHLLGSSTSGAKVSESPARASESKLPTQKQSHGARRAVLWTVALLFCAVLLVGGYYAIRVNRIFNTINSVSAPTGELSGEALGGSADIKIDTGPAKTALAGGSNSFSAPVPTEVPSGGNELIAEPPRPSMNASFAQTAESTPTASSTHAPIEPTSTPGTLIGGSQSATEVPPSSTSTPTPSPTAPPVEVSTAVPSPTPAPVFSQIERVKNGDFELGNDGSWYLDQGAVIDASGGADSAGALSISTTGGYADQRLFYVPETGYHLTAKVRLSTKPAKGETIQLGIIYTDETDTRLTASEPVPIAITETDWADVSIDYTPPADAAHVLVFFWKVSGDATLTVDDVSVRSIVPEEALNTQVIPSSENSMTILLMGVDARPGEAIDIGVRPDSLMVLHLNGDSGSCRVLSIPRDTRTELPGYGLTKINHALAVGGIDYEVQVVENLLGLQIDHYILIDFNGFEDLVDAMGGISVDVPEAFVNDDGRVFNTGVQSMTGVQALSYARWRGGADGDFGRMQRQQLILRALVEKASGLNVVRSINELLPAVEANLRTDLSPTQMASIATDYRSGCTESNISMIRLEGSAATYDDPLLQLPLYYIEVEPAEIRSKVAMLIEP